MSGSGCDETDLGTCGRYGFNPAPKDSNDLFSHLETRTVPIVGKVKDTDDTGSGDFVDRRKQIRYIAR